jgi:flagellar biosynthesis/type III secretory pathway protein FliH
VRAPEFVSLADLLLPSAPEAALPSQEPERQPVAAERVDDALPDVASALRAARLFRAQLADALTEAFGTLLCDLAADVLARELRLAPCDLEALVQRVAERAPIVRVRVAPADVPRIRSVAVEADAALDPGDAIVELAGGAIDARLGVRLASVLEAFA